MFGEERYLQRCNKVNYAEGGIIGKNVLIYDTDQVEMIIPLERIHEVPMVVVNIFRFKLI